MTKQNRSSVDEEQREISLAPFTSWHIGGVADRYFCPSGVARLSDYLQTLSNDTPCTWLGLGSNVLVRDGGVRGVVIATRHLQDLFLQEEKTVFAQAGLTCAKLARFSARQGFSEAAFFAGIPGTVGGALAMNAGAFGGETWEWVKAVQVINRQGETFYRTPDEYHIDYRHVVGKDACQKEEAFVGAVFHFPSETSDEGENKIKELLRKRSESQPIGTFNCGSVFRNPPGDYAARLIEASGLKGYQVGNAMVSLKHANFIINCGKARSEDVEILMNTIESEVNSRFGISLEREVKILGEKEQKA